MISEYAYCGEYLTWTTDGANAGTIFYRNGKFNITNVCGLLKPKIENVDIRYLYFILGVTTEKYVNKGMGNPKLMSNTMARISIPLPSLEEQKRIAAILDSYDGLCHDISTNLSAELEKRQLQYQYYLNKLLTLKEIA